MYTVSIQHDLHTAVGALLLLRDYYEPSKSEIMIKLVSAHFTPRVKSYTNCKIDLLNLIITTNSV